MLSIELGEIETLEPFERVHELSASPGECPLLRRFPVSHLALLGCGLLIAALLTFTAGPARAGGFLWMGSEFQGEGTIYRFNLQTMAIDLVQSPAGATGHWNNAATEGGFVYFGSPTSNRMDRRDAYTGALIGTYTHSPALSGHKEDGAFFDNSLWRMTYSGGALHRLTTTGVRETTFTVTSSLVGIEFVRGQAFASSYSSGRIGRLNRTGATSWTFVSIPWGGIPPTGIAGGLAYDAQAGVLYYQTSAPRLYRVDIAGDSAYATSVALLTDTGFPIGGLGDGLGWVPPQNLLDASGNSTTGADLRVGPPAPNPARQTVSFDLSLPRAAATRIEILDVGGRRWRSWNLPGLGAGTSRFQWSLRSEDGRRAPAGRYLVRVMSGGEVRTSSFSIVR